MLASVKAGYIGRFVMQIENLKLCWLRFKNQSQGLPADFYENYIKKHYRNRR
jgi:hypothetical protein